MKVIIAGSRHMPSEHFYKIDAAITMSGFQLTEVVCGMARGADLMGKQWAAEHNIPVAEFPADWAKYGKSAGTLRNSQMRDYADAAIIFIYANSRGSLNMWNQMQAVGKPTFVINC